MKLKVLLKKKTLRSPSLLIALSDPQPLSELRILLLAYNEDLSGPLPGTFTRLGNLQALDLYATGLCVPPDTAFQTWLERTRAVPDAVYCESFQAAVDALSHADLKPELRSCVSIANEPICQDTGRVVLTRPSYPAYHRAKRSFA